MVRILTLLIFLIPFFSYSQNIEWETGYGGPDDEDGRYIQQTSDGGYIAAGASHSQSGDVSNNHGLSDFWIFKMDNQGNLVWEQNYGGTESEKARMVNQTNDGGYIIVGETESSDNDVSNNKGGTDFWAVKTDSSGAIEWEKSYGGSDDETPFSVQQTQSGGFVIAGNTLSSDGDVSSNQGGTDFWVINLDNSGVLQWENAYGGSLGDYGRSIQQTSDGGFIVGGYSGSSDGDVSGNHGLSDFWILKLDNNGNISWENNYGGSSWDRPWQIRQTQDGGYIVGGYSQSSDYDVSQNQGEFDYWVLKLNGSGGIEWENSFGGSNDDRVNSIKQTSDGGYLVGGKATSSDGDVTKNGDGDAWVLRLDTTGALQWEENYGDSGGDEIVSVQQTSDGGYVTLGNSASDDKYWILKLGNSGTSISEESYDLNFAVSPVPFNHTLTIDLHQYFSNPRVSLIDAHGRVVLEESLSNTIQLNLTPRISPGIYLIKIETAKGIYTKKVIKR